MAQHVRALPDCYLLSVVSGVDCNYFRVIMRHTTDRDAAPRYTVEFW